ncbi:MAG: hypothetical protein COW00_17720 [Bdellovibrio sp. CG12_big_fil_rev_8_21_14_0_65_39_13]|nr:MAG: hypothetical protein COW78_06445 [Bdellovibrio sp. CG22_combo_CG10-13_8_21_14_all_39_27]PIQ57949.1 MAG: hypothetical protein COW00_17720 [Bdellovibrio sp. CG12_big_fil_rev_8_21_14_0_65_39_13]PIR32915.1 MAG: hypothetical protein COV37_17615 [Bdellovibrio sp. CG11_big_fil_rev_8_21_14_0_20_39_38]PJB53477.1 MAG: hypothetical protein CO099_06960 [Bdellovibrio sp. CG_4_9_14_3_um_filter_39_7]
MKQWCKIFDEKFKNQIAIVDENDLEITYGELYQACFLLHNKIKESLGLKRRSVLLYLNPDADFVISFFAILMAGHTPFLVTMDLKNELESLSQHFDSVLTKSSYYDYLSKFIALDKLDIVEFEKEKGELSSYKDFVFDENQAMFNSHSSGSTGVPKLIPGTLKKFLKTTRGKTISQMVSSNDFVFSLAPFNHAYGFLVGVFIPFYYGSRIRIKNNGFSFQDICNASVINETTLVVSTPPVFKYLVEYMDTLPKNFFEKCRYFISSAAKLDENIIEKFKEYFNLKIFEIYGSTEGLIVGTRDTSQTLNWKIEEEIEWKVEATQELLIKTHLRPNQEEEIWFSTGDLVNILDESKGIFELSGRLESFIKVKGVKVYVHEIEQSLKQLPLIKEVVVIKHPAEEESIAFIVPTEEGDPKKIERTIREFCSQKVASSRIPNIIKILSEIPRNKTGKVVLSDLKKLI